MASNSIKKYIAKLKANENWVGDNASSEKSKSTNLDWRSEYIARIKSGAAAKTYEDEQKSKALLRNNPGYVYSKVYGDGTKGKAAASKIETGKGNGYISVWDGDAVKRNNPGYAYLQQAGGGEKLTKGSDAISAGDIEWYKKILRGIDVGLTDFSKSLVSAADVVTSLGDEDGGPLQELWYMFGGDRIAEAAGDNALGIKGLNFKDNPIKAFNKLGEKEIEYRQKRDAAYADNPLYKYSAVASETAAMMASTLMGGGLAATVDTAALANAARIGQAASKLSQTGAIAQNAIKQFATRPDAQVIFGSSFGSSYDEAKQDGADDLQALVYAALNGAGNAVTELGGVSELGGLQKLPEWVKKAVNKGDKSLLLNYAKSIGEEASEEIIQGILGRGLKSIYSDVPLYDANDENSIINPKAALEEATGAAVVSTLLGLPTTGINAAYRAKQRGETGQRLYGNSQRELVDEGLESERGTKSYELARKYDEKLNSGKQLSGNELYKLAQANEKAQTNEGTAVQSVPEAQTNEESPTLPYAALNREQQLSGLRNYVAQRSEMSAPVNTNVSNSEAVSESINNVAAKINATPEFVSRVYNLNPVESPEAFEMAFDAVYQMGQQGANKESLTKVPVLNRAQAEIAYNMGASTTQAAVDNVAVQGDNVSTQVNNQVSNAVNNTIQEVNNNGVRLRDSGQRLNGQNTEGQIPSVERGTVEAYAGTDSGRQSGYSAAQGQTGQKVVYNGVEQENVYYSGEDTESMKKGRELARSYGYKVTYFEGGNIKDSGGEFRGMVDTESKTVMVRSDHPDISAEQIMRHEMGHAAIAQGDISLDELRNAMLSDLSEKELNSAVEVYRHAYGDTISEAEAFEEMCCDALGKLNIFAGTEHDSANYGKVQESFRKHTAETANKGRAPPKKGGVMFSRQAEDKYFARQIDQWDGKDHGGAFRVGGVSEPLLKVGIPNTDIWFDQSKAAKQLLEKGEITKAVIKQIPVILQHPIAISESYDSTVMVFGQVFDATGNPIVVALRVNSTKRRNSITLVNKIRSVGSRFHNLDKLLNDSNILYLGENKKETKAWFNALGRSTPFGGTKFGLIRSVSFADTAVKKYSLEPVKPIQPKNNEWERGSTTDEVRAKHPDLWAVDAESSESRNPTQISGTVKSYRKIYDALKAEGFDGTVLDASSGLGYGTRAGIEEYGFNVEDIEPFPDSSYKPKYTDYSKLHKKYDVIISNAVLNVLPQDQRDALVVKMGQMLNDGGRMFINVRGTDVKNASSKVAIDEANMEYYISNTGSYQKGFTKRELVAYLSDALGKDYTVVGTNKFGAVSTVVTKQAEVSKKFSLEPKEVAENVKQAETYFGTTYKISEAGYILTDGKMLDFSGRHEGAHGGYRTVDHRDITDALGEEYGGDDYSGGLVQFMSEGNIRVSPEIGGINLSVAPNKTQRSTLDRYISSFRGEVILDIDEVNGNTVASVEYPKYTHSSVVLKDIDDYFNKGKTPEAFTRYSREPESITELRRQNETMLAQATNEDAANDNERGLIKDYKRQYDKVSGIAEKLNTARQEVLTAENGGGKNAIATARNRFTLLSRKYAEEHRKLSDYANIKALGNVLTRVKDRTAENPLPEGMGAASAEFTGEETRGERWVTEAQGKGDSALHPISREQQQNLAEQQHRAPQEIPKEDLNGKLTSKHVSTLANSGVTPAEFSDALREDAAQGKFSHIAYSDEAALKKAEITIEATGWEQALADYKAQINAGKVSKDNTVMGIALYNNAVNSGDYATALDIASLMVKNSTNTAQSLQAMRILNKLSPECKLYLAAKSVETIEEDLNEKYKDNKADIHVDKVLYDEYGKALRSGDEDSIKTAWAKIEQSVAQQIDATWYEKLNNFRYLAMLGNPRTHVRNIVGNAFFVPVRAVKNTIAYGLENVADSKVNGGIERSKAMLNRNNANDVALIKYAMTDYEAVQETILSGGKYVDTFQGIDKKRTIYKTKILEAARKGNSNLLDAEDAWFCKPAYANALAKWYKANGITAEQLNTGKVPESTIIKAQTVAIKEAQKATYRDTNRFSAMVSRLGKVDNKVASALIEGVLPFKKTPANILVRAVEYSPVGLIKSLAVDTKKVKAYVNGDVENGMSPAQFIDDVSAGLTGTALMGLGVLFASWGLLSGGEGDDEKQNNFDDLSGKQNYALNIGGLSITLDWLAPESMPLFVGVELYNSLSGKSEDNGFVQNLMSSVMSLSTPMLEMSMLQSVNDLFDNLAYIKQGQGSFKIVTSMATNYISQYFPTLFGQTERSFEEAQRETTYIDRNSKVGSELQYMWGKIANKIPLYDFSQIPYIDAWGRTEETGNLFERVLNNFVNPAYVKKERSTEIDGELKRLYDLGETSVYPSRAKTNTKINGEYLTAEEYVKYATVKGQTSYDLATKIINSSAYSRASDAEKAYMLSYVYKYADHIAKYEVNNESSLAKWEAAAYKSSNPAQGIIDHAQEYWKRKEDDES